MAMGTTAERKSLLMPDGSPVPMEMLRGSLPDPREEAVSGEELLKAVLTVTTALSGLNIPAIRRARDPFNNHPWVYAAAIAVALNGSAADFVVMRETPDQVK